MPSFMIHSITGKELLKKLHLSKDQEMKFFIANILPDTRQIERNPEWDEVELRKNIQQEKKITHFRGERSGILEYPNLKLFLDKYGHLIKEDIIVFGYFFHLYMDYYYFHTFLPKIITFLDKDYKETHIKADYAYIKVNKDKRIIEKLDFWSKSNPIGLYQEYSRINSYLIEKYDFTFNYKKYKKYLEENNYPLKIEEIKVEKVHDLLDELDVYYHETDKYKGEEYTIFTKKDLDNLIQETIETFINEYGEFMNITKK